MIRRFEPQRLKVSVNSLFLHFRAKHWKNQHGFPKFYSSMTETFEVNQTAREIAEKIAELNTYPCELLTPKTQTQQARLLEKYPTYDGRGIVMAILDTGVDPSLPGLQQTTTGERKILDCVDCSGAGDVDTSTVKSPVDGVIVGLSGRSLKIPAEWENPTNKYHLGIKPIYQLYTKNLLKLIRNEKKGHVWGPMHQITLADTQRLLKKHEESVGGKSEKIIEKYEREDLACRVDYLNNIANVEDKGPVADCLVWHDGKKWKACLDTSFRGRLKLCTPMGNYRETGEYDFLSDRDKAAYTFRIGPNGNYLEIVCTIGSHGSHVAGIAAAHFPEDPKRNGLAPGAKIVSLTIGDNRLNAMETGAALTKAFNMCADYGVHVLNMSFGEATHLVNEGRVIEELQYLVSKYNVICCISAGNNGPSISSVGCPGGTSSYVIGVGACVFPSMVDPLYGSLAKIESMPFSWSSRGPAADGDLGVSICAPGAAFAEVPKSNRSSNKMMQGTSMSSPNAAGAVACLLSGLKDKEISWSYFLVRLALENTAAKINNVDMFSQGHGVLQIDNAFNYLLENGRFVPENLIDFKISTANGSRGIYMRDSLQKHFSVSVTPTFGPFPDVEEMIGFEKKFLLTCDVPWVSFPKTFRLASSTDSFRIEINHDELEAGSINYTEICAIDTANPGAGPLFRVPITVIVPLITPGEEVMHLACDVRAGIPTRYFVKVPACATLINFKLKPSSANSHDMIGLNCLQLCKHTAFNQSELALTNIGAEGIEGSMQVFENKTVEITLTKGWTSSDSPIKVQVEVKFHGARLYSPYVLLHDVVSRTFVGQVAFRREVIEPQFSCLLYVEMVKQSSAYKIEPMGHEDIFRNGYQTNRLVLTYKYKVKTAGKYSLEFDGLTDYLYESFVDCVNIQIFTLNKEYIGSCGIYPRRNIRILPVGEYIIKAQIRHPSVACLEEMRDLPLCIGYNLPSPICLDIFRGICTKPSTPNKQAKNKISVGAGEEFSFFVSSIPSSKLKNIAPKAGSFLMGVASFFPEKMDAQRFFYYFGENAEKSSAGLSKVVIQAKSKTLTEQEKMEEALRDFHLMYIHNLKDPKIIKEVFDQLVAKYPNHIPIYSAKLMKLFDEATHMTPEGLEELDGLVTKIIELCEPNEVFQWLGCRPEALEDRVDEQREMNVRKTAIIQALIVKANQYADCHLKRSTLQIPPALREKTKPIITDLENTSTDMDQTSVVEEETPVKIAVEVQKDSADVIETEKAEESASGKVKLDDDVNDIGKSEEKPEGSEKKPAESERETARISREQLDNVFFELTKWISPDDSKVLLIAVKQAVAHEHYGRALKYLDKLKEFNLSKGLPTSNINKIIQEICDILGWVHISNFHRNQALHENPPDFRPFQCF